MINSLLKLSFVIVLTAAAAMPAAGGTVSIVIGRDAVVKGDIVYLGEIADISGDEAKAALLRKTSLGYAPSIGTVRSIPVRKIRLVIAAAGINESEFRLRSPDNVLVRRSGQAVDPLTIRSAVEAEIEKSFNPEIVKFKISRIEIPEVEDMPVGNLEIHASLENTRNLLAPFYLPVELRVSNQTVRKISVRVEIEAEAEILVAADDIPVSTRLTESMLVPETRRLDKPVSDYLLPNGDNRGIRSSRAVRRGEAVTRDSYVADIVVRNGDPVRIIAQSGRLELTVSGIAQSAGRIGERISVKNLQSEKLLQAIIIDEGIVKIFF